MTYTEKAYYKKYKREREISLTIQIVIDILTMIILFGTGYAITKITNDATGLLVITMLIMILFKEVLLKHIKHIIKLKYITK